MFILTCGGRRFIAVRAMYVSSAVSYLREHHGGAVEVAKRSRVDGEFVEKVLATISAITKG